MHSGLIRLTKIHFPALGAAVLGMAGLLSGCTTAEPRTSANTLNIIRGETRSQNPNLPTIAISPGGPADTVRTFYKFLRENKIREALGLTNMRSAIEGLTDAELKEYSPDFADVAKLVPEVIEINGEIISGGKATVTAKLPNDDGDGNEVQAINLRKDGDGWVILSVDDAAETRIRAEGKAYFQSLKIDVKQEEARQMLERISKAQLAHSLQNSGRFADAPVLIAAGLLPEDINTSESTGYNYAIVPAPDRSSYFATATPGEYNKTGRLSFLLQLDGKGISRVTTKDNGGKSLRE